ncbi:hypothetical protein [Arthrobacter zhaoguopingii]|uniref:hypothetical protein n=1 Tax=Arthrobacter zhaoguopingii TaxID=2681491 RepID=UPI001FE7C60B|nr:hypothetical protein [Arthrobacter zhaoguopingii]
MTVQTHTRGRKQLRLALLAVPFAALLGACSQVEDTARDAVSSAATAATGEVKEKICSVTEDGLVSVRDKEILGSLIAPARTAGVPEAILAPADRLAESGDAVPDDALSELRGACGQEPEPSAT